MHAPGALEAAPGAGTLEAAAWPEVAQPLAAAAPPAPEGPDAWGDWRRIPDATSGKCYYYNAATAETTWTQPQGWGSALAPALAGWFYRDLSGDVQGPFDMAQLRAWRGALPMELQVWWSDGSAAPGPAAVAPLAQVLGDGELLALLRAGQLPLPPRATAAQADQLLAEAAAVADAQGTAWWEAQERDEAAAPPDAAAADAGDAGGADDEDGEGGGGGGFCVGELAAAALAGLPPEERSRVLAGGGADEPRRREPAAPVEYESAPVLNKLTGRLTSSTELRGEDALAAKRGASGAIEYFSAQMDQFCDTTKLESWLTAMKARKHEKLPPAVLKALKERRAAAKRKANTAWLRD